MFHLQLGLVVGLSLVSICAAGGKEKFDKAIAPLRGLLQAKIFNNGIIKAKFERSNVDGSQKIVGVVQAPNKAPAYELSQLEQDLKAKVDATIAEWVKESLGEAMSAYGGRSFQLEAIVRETTDIGHSKADK